MKRIAAALEPYKIDRVLILGRPVQHLLPSLSSFLWMKERILAFSSGMPYTAALRNLEVVFKR